MNRPEIEAMQARCDAATKGPWAPNESPHYHRGQATLVWGKDGPGHGAVCETCPSGLAPSGAELAQVEANATHIASARTDLPELIAWALELENEKLEDHRLRSIALGRDRCLCPSCTAHRSRNR